MTTTSPGCDRCPPRAASIAGCSRSKTRAGPSNTSASKPAVLTTAPSGASDPRRIGQPAGAVDRRRSIARMISPSGSGGLSSREVLGHRLAGHGEGVAVQQAGVEQRLHDDRDAADPVDVGHHVPAERLDVGQVRNPVADPVEVVQVEVDLAPRAAMASRCSTALVEPPSAITTAIAFSNASLVMICAGGDALARAARRRPRPSARAKPSRRRSTAGGAAEPGRDMPSASAAEAIVFAVYMPPQAPSPGQMARSIASTSSRVISPRAHAPTASNASMIVTSSVRREPAGQRSSRRRGTPRPGRAGRRP